MDIKVLQVFPDTILGFQLKKISGGFDNVNDNWLHGHGHWSVMHFVGEISGFTFIILLWEALRRHIDICIFTIVHK